MATKKKLLQAAAGSAGGGGLNVEDVFSTYLYTGNDTSQTITNGIDLSGEGGMTWLKTRNDTHSHYLFDTERGAGYYLNSDTTGAQAYHATAWVTAFNSDGFDIGYSVAINDDVNDHASWTFRKAPKFFDVVTYTGNGTAGRTISHNLGSVPGMIIVRQRSSVANWAVYHRSLGSAQYINLNTTDAKVSNSTRWYGTDPTSTDFTVNVTNVNKLNETYVAYLFAHNNGDGEFGPDGDADIIKCGSYSGDGTTNGTNEVTLGWEPQWILTKRSDSADNWHICDVMRGQTTDGITQRLRANTSAAESSNYGAVPTPTGFKLYSDNSSGGTYIYIAIRRGPMAVPESATDVFGISYESSSSYAGYKFTTTFPVDALLQRTNLSSTNNNWINSRLQGEFANVTNLTIAEADFNYRTDFMDGFAFATNQTPSTPLVGYSWRRAPNFFDVVAYTGTGSARTISHNLGVAPEMMWVKKRDQAENWLVYHSATGNTKSLRLNSTIAAYTDTNWNDTTPTDSVFSLGSSSVVNYSGHKFIAYLFASLDGVSKVFSVTKSSGSDASVNCGFSAGPRFVLLKRTDSTGDWYVWDSERGIVAGNDPYLLLNSTAAEVTSTDYIDPTSNGFTIVNGGLADGDYIGYAVA
jgi:hypothetical protein